jgi:uncharacterized protein (DUF983 family)
MNENKDYVIVCPRCGNKENFKADRNYIKFSLYCECSKCDSEYTKNIN